MLKRLVTLVLLCVCVPLLAQSAKPFDAAVAFGARPSIIDLSLSPDGASVVYVVPIADRGSAVYTRSLAAGAKEQMAMTAAGKPDRISGCDWVSNARLVCSIYAATYNSLAAKVVTFTRLVAVDADGKNLQLLSKHESVYAQGVAFFGGDVVDWLPNEDNAVLMARNYVPDEHLGSSIGSAAEGLGVDWVDTRTLASKRIEPPSENAVDYISDGQGNVRIVALRERELQRVDTGVISYRYRQRGSRDWHKLSDYDSVQHSGFLPLAVDPDLNVAYGFKKTDGRMALYSVSLDDSLQEKLIYANPEVDLSRLMTIGRRHRVVGVTYDTDGHHAEVFVPELAQLLAALSKALPEQPSVRVADASADESKLLIFAGSDTDPGAYYLFDRKAHALSPLLAVREPLRGAKLAHVKAVSYPGADGVTIPAYLTLPPAAESAKGLPAIVLPHGGPSARDVLGFNWLAQFYAARGYAVLQPNFRGSCGYGDAWLEKNGFKSWSTAIGDVLAAGHWLVKEGIADPSKLGIVGWSYGGYAALQSAVVEPGFFKAVVAIAPITDLSALRNEWSGWSNAQLQRDFVGDGPEMHAGSPIEHTDKIKVPVLLFHGGADSNVSVEQSRRMAARLKASGSKCELVTWDDLDHQLEASTARTQMLRESDSFLRTAFGM
ncbi:MAG: S9 family peptidase [Gammaproteobacteria bacterium]|nr:S9 family peptidase [Gammaproteobacteria bacterium]